MRDIVIHGEIGTNVTSEQVAIALGEAGPEEDVRILLNSPGGSYFDGIAMASEIRKRGKRVKCRIEALCASAATLVACACSEVTMAPGALMMVHNPSTSVCGDASDLKAAVQSLEEISDAVLDIYEKRTRLPREELVSLMEGETWMNGKRAKALGFVDSIEDETEEALEPLSMRLNLLMSKPPRAAVAALMRLEAEMSEEKPDVKPAEEVKAEEPKAEEVKAEEPKAEEPKAEEAKAEEPKAEEPKVDMVANLTAELVSMKAALDTLVAERDEARASLAAMKAEADKAAHAALVDRLCRDGKVTPAMKAWADGLALAELKAFAENAPVVVNMEAMAQPPADKALDWASMSPDDKAVLAAENPDLYYRLKAEN